MSSLDQRRLDDRQLEQYVLGLLSDEEAERLDEACIADSEAASRLRIVEDDLVDGYVRGTLRDETRARFEAYYLASPRRRERVRFAARFVRAVDQATAAAEAGAQQTAATAAVAECDECDAAFGALHRGRVAPRLRLAWKLAFAAVLVLVVSGTLFLETVRLRDRLSAVQQERAAFDRRAGELERQLSDQRAATATAVKELADAREPQAKPAQPAAPLPVRRGAPLESRAIALILLPQTRAVASVPTLTVPAGADSVTLELQLESNDFARYQVGLKDPATNQVIWQSGQIEAKSSASESSIAVTVPTDVLSPQHYSLDVAGLDGNNRRVVGSYAFQILP